MDGSAADEEREEELSTIAAIFPEIQIDPKNPFAASLEIPVELSSPLHVVFSPSSNGAPPKHPPNPSIPNNGWKEDGAAVVAAPARRETHSLEFLPPLSLRVVLPEGYPADKPAQFHLSSNPNWLSHDKLRSLEAEGKNLWEEYGHVQVVFAYIDFIQQAAERAFDIRQSDDAIVELPDDFQASLLDFDKAAKKRKFEQGTYDCGICLEPKKGTACYRMTRCGHVFCISCLQDFYNNAIKEGDIGTVRCLDPTCGEEKPGSRRKKKQRTLSPRELLNIPLEYSVVRRYVELKRKKKIESDKDTIYCPRKWCQGPARSKKYPKITSLDQYESSDSEGETEQVPPPPPDPTKPPVEDRLAVCEDCTFAFCRTCLAGWHGEFVRCWPRSADELSQEEQASYNYIRLRTSACPTCSSPSQKTMGCNHMTCFQCRTHFCYLCTSWLDPGNPYEHFNNPKKPCYMRLWELEEGDEGQAVHFDGIRGAEHAALVAAQEAQMEELAALEAINGAVAAQGAVPPEAPVPPPPEHGRVELVEMVRRLEIRDVPEQGQQPRVRGERLRGRGQGAGGRGGRGRGQGRGRGGANAVARQDHPDAHDHAGHARGAADDVQRRGLQRFLEMAMNDEEDEWDSDELEGDDDEFAAFR